MNTLNKYLSILLFLTAFVGVSQEKVNEDTFTYKKINTLAQDEGTLKLTGGKNLNTNSSAAKTKTFNNPKGMETPGFLSVSPNGGAIYQVPIAVPPGINGVAPEVSLSYNSQGSIGMAGYGWNVSGVSVISKVAANTYYDGEIDPVDLDASDRFSFNGNRLILKSGVYGGDGAVYETANFSNLKIVSHGVDSNRPGSPPLYFVVYYPDGSIAEYRKNYLANYAITLWRNPQGLVINYEYSNITNSLAVSKIKYGNRENLSAVNEIEFLYNQKLNRKEQAYLRGFSLQRREILSDVIVRSNNSTYRSYKLSYNFTNLNYPRVDKIQEFSGDGSIANKPIEFNYTNSEKLVSYVDKNTDLSLTNINQQNAKTVSLDLTGNGKMDFLVYPKANKNKFWLFKDIQNGSTNLDYQVNTGVFETIFPSKLLSHNNKILPGQGITIVQNTLDNKVNFKSYANGSANPIYYQYNKTWNVPTYTYDYTLTHSEQRRVEQKYISGDFNGDGITDVLALSKSYRKQTCSPVPGDCTGDDPQEIIQQKGESKEDFLFRKKQAEKSAKLPIDCYECNSYLIDTKAVYFIDLKRDNTTNFSNYAGKLELTLSSRNKIFTGDFNGDGKTDIMQAAHGKIYVYGLDKQNKLDLLWVTDSPLITLDKPILIGDYNGDGKTDFITPRYGGVTNPLGSDQFATFLSKGNGFRSNYESKAFKYRLPQWSGPDTNRSLATYNLVPVDVDGDGRTDIIEYNTYTYSNNSNGRQTVKVFHNNGLAYNASRPNDIRFIAGGIAGKSGNLKHYPVPIFLSSDQKNKNLDFASISDRSITSFSFTMDHREDVLLRYIMNNGVRYVINYDNLDPANNNSNSPQVYQHTSDETYPYANINIASGTKLVSSLERISGILAPRIRQEFAYYDAIYNVQGLGFVGFKGMAQSNWHTGISDRIFNISKYDPKQRGALTEQYSLRNYHSFTVPSSNYITKTVYQNSYSLSSSKVFKLKNDSYLTQNSIDGTFTNVIYQYDQYNNPEKITTNYSGQGTHVLDIQYENSFGSNYYIGRTTKQSETKTIGNETFRTQKRLEYTGYLLTKKRTNGNGTAPDTEDYEYDVFGNLTKKTVTPHQNPPRTIQFSYDTSGRFLEESIDVEGQSTTYEYNINSATLKSETSPQGLKTSYEYDAWFRPTKITDYLGKSITTEYTHSIHSEYTVKNTGDDGTENITVYDKLDRVKIKQEKDVLGQWVKMNYLYDKFDRAYRESQPYTGNGPTQWTETEYDFFSRPIKQTLHTGREINMTYNSLSVTVNDGVKTVTTTNDAIGNTKSVTDPGGTINYTHFGNGNLKTANYGGTIVSREQDGWGRKTKLIDPSAGTYQYEYNGFGEIIKEKTPKGETNYVYSDIGKLQEKTIIGDDVDMTMLYEYNANNKLLNKVTMTSADGNNSSYRYIYDNLHRVARIQETNPYARFAKFISYDDFGRINTERSYAKLVSNNKRSIKTIKNEYQNGALKSITDSASGELLWSIEGVNARGQATKVSMGNNLTEESIYTSLGYLQENKVMNNGSFIPEEIMKLTTSFNAERGTLNSRTNSLFSWSETFQYDNLDRLINFNDNDSDNEQTYDALGRIKTNNVIGEYNYTGRAYQVDDITLNTQGDLYYQNNSLQQVSYNPIKKPVEIYELGKEKVSFDYNAYLGRASRFYGDTQEDKLLRNNRKHYSFDGSMEISHDLSTNKTTFVTYIGGDAYNAPTIWKSEQGDDTGTIEDYYFLHRDYLGSIIMISDKDGGIKEKRHFDAWGNLVKVADGNNNALTKLTFLDRGYTGHEHLDGVSLIHMNGRLYDPKLRRFLAPDNHIQDPYNTQSFNRYGYAWNNPLMYTDLNGEFIVETIIIVKIVKALLASYLLNSLYIALTDEDSSPAEGATPSQVSTPSSNNNAFANSTGYITHPSLDNRLDQPMGIFQMQDQAYIQDNNIPVMQSSEMINEPVANGNQIDGDDGFSITAADVGNTIADFVPLAGGVNDIRIGLNTGNNWQVALGIGSIVLDIFTLGSSSLVKGVVKTGIKAGIRSTAKKSVKKGVKTWNQFQKKTAGQFSSRADAGQAWAAYKKANKIITGTKNKRSQTIKRHFLKQAAASGKHPKWMNQWLKKGKVPPGFNVDHQKALFDGGLDEIPNLRLKDISTHVNRHRYYRK